VTSLLSHKSSIASNEEEEKVIKHGFKEENRVK
jgi:hypothetical protein